MKTHLKTLLSGLVLLSSFVGLAANPPGILNHQGLIQVDDTPFDGAGSFKFALVDATGATTYWSNDGTSSTGHEPTGAVSLSVSKGIYSVALGDTSLPGMTAAMPASVFEDNADVRLRVWFNDGINGSQSLSPDQRLASVGYALSAVNAQSAASVDADNITGILGLAQLPTTIVTNGASGVNISGTFTGDGSALTQLDSTQLTGPLSFQPGDPINVGHVNDGSLARGVAVAGNYAYLANDDDGLRVYELPSDAVLTGGLAVSNTVSAAAFVGDGSGLTGITGRRWRRDGI